GYLPGSRVVGEEAATADPAVLEALGGEDPVWILDPVDGTLNFVNGIDKFAVMAALVRRDEILMGWIYAPVEGAVIWAEQGAGTWVKRAGAEARRQIIPAPADSSLAAQKGIIHHKELKALQGRLRRVPTAASAAHDYWALAEGRVQVLAYNR